uniref:UspA domain-containing protein n=1 Tax=Ciona savignyi TaxID=51511 RepID=H2YBS7_CIOSA
MKVLISVDGSKIAAKAFEWYFEHIHKEGNEVIICHISEQPAIPTYIFVDENVLVAYTDDIEKLREEATKKRDSLKKVYETKMEGKNVTATFLFNFTDTPVGEAIVQIANKEQCDAIIMGSRGMGIFRRTILGSVSDYVMHHAKATVMVCHS